MPDLAVAALAHSALHMALEAHVDMVVADALLTHLGDHEAIHDRRAAHRAEGVRRADLKMLEGLGGQAHFAIPGVVGVVDGQVQVEVLAMTPHLELVAEHDLGGVLRTVDDGYLAEVAALVVDVVDEAAKRRDAQAAGNQQDIVALHLLEREAAAERPADAHDVAALHLVQRLGEATGAAHAQLDEAAFGGARRNGDGSLAHAEDGQLDELARLMTERLADALVDQTELEQLLGCRQLGDGRDARRPRAIRVGGHELLARHGCRLIVIRRYNHGVEIGVSRHLRPPSSRRTPAREWG